MVKLETSVQWMCVFQLGNSRAVHIMLEKNVFWHICLLLFWVPRQIKLSYYDLQMKVPIAERLMELKEGRVSHSKIFFLEFHVKTQGKIASLYCPFTRSSYIPSAYFPLILLNFKPLAQKHLGICHCNSLALTSCLWTQLSFHWAVSVLARLFIHREQF